MNAESTTGPDGSCRIDDRFAGPATVHVRADGFAEALDLAIDLPGTTTLVVPLDPGITLTGSVVDAETGAPVTGAEIRFVRRRDATWSGEAVAKSDGNGRFKAEHVPASKRWVASMPGEGRYAVEMTSDRPAGDREIEFRMRRAAGFRVRCVDGKGNPIADAIVAAISVHSRSLTFDVVFDSDYDESADTDEAGVAAVKALHPGDDDRDLRLFFFLEGVLAGKRIFPPLRDGEDRDLGDVVLGR